ncbi:MAG: glutamine synthetase, partial [Clostridia bacterium]|nr:glutamine synthetase [Clostridia bacterium]
QHKRIIFNGDNYSEEWVKEAEKRGLLNLPTTMDVLPRFVDQKNIDLFTRHKVFTAEEMHSRYEIMVDHYCKTLNIEARTLNSMIRRDILPAVGREENQLAKTIIHKKQAIPGISCTFEEQLLQELSDLTQDLYTLCVEFEKKRKYAKTITPFYERGIYYRDEINTDLARLRNIIDRMEILIPTENWPFPTYYDLLFSVH